MTRCGTTLCASLTVVALVLAFPSAASAHGWALDRGFGEHGYVMTAIPVETAYEQPQVDLAAAPGEKIVAGVAPSTLSPPTGAATVIRYLANGSPDQTFGNHGRLRISESQVTPSSTFRLAGVGVDSLGRVIVAGTTYSGCAPVCAEWISLVTVMRFLPNGQIDTTFGHEGVTQTDLGLPAPENLTHGYPGFQPPLQANPSIDHMRLDPQGRIVVAGSATADASLFRLFPTLDTAPLIARFTPDGQPDPSFGTGGAVLLRDHVATKSTVHGLAIDSLGRIVAAVCGFGPYGELFPSRVGVVRLEPTGAEDQTFGPGGLRETPDCPEAIAVDRFRRILVLRPPTVDPTGEYFAGVQSFVKSLERWKASGLADSRFGRGGAVTPHTHRSHIEIWQNVTTDPRGRVIPVGEIAGTKILESPEQKLAVNRLLRSGVSDRRFGHGGRIVTGLGRLREILMTSLQVIDGHGRIVVAVATETSGSGKRISALSLVRYTPRS